MPSACLLAVLAEVPDPRPGPALQHAPPAAVLGPGHACGRDVLPKITAFIALQRERLNAVFGACFRRAPAVNTLRHLFLALGHDDLEAAFRCHACDLNGHSRPEALRTVALDGKTLRGSVEPRGSPDTANLFVFLDAHRPWRHVKVTERRTARDFALCMRDLADKHYPRADLNLNRPGFPGGSNL